MTARTNSPLLGPSRETTKEEDAKIAELAKEAPVALFEALDRRLNARGRFLLIYDIPKEAA